MASNYFDLYVIGYSFRDEHINELIRRWFNRADDPKIVVVDPQLTGLRRPQRQGGFIAEVIRVTHRFGDGEWTPIGRHDLIGRGAKDALPHLFEA